MESFLNMKNENILAILIIIIIIALIVIIFSVFNGNSIKTNQDTIKIGAVVGLSGIGQFTGPQTFAGMQLASNEINSNGGINGKKIQLIVEDSKGIPQDGISAFNKINDLNSPNVIVSVMSGVSNSLAPLALEKKIPMIAIINSDPNIARNNYSFRFYPYSKQENEPVLKIIKDKNAKKVAILYQNDDFGDAIYQNLKENYKGDLYSEYFPTGSNDFKTQLLKIKEKNPDVLVVTGFGAQSAEILKQIKELDINTSIIGCSILALPDTIKAAGDSAEGSYVVAPIFYSEDNQKANEFREKFKGKYPNLVIDHYAASGYDTIYLIKHIIEKNGDSREDIKTGLTNIKDNDFSGILGNITVEGRNIVFPLKEAIIHGGKIKYLE
jgi:branched-chain amino acid transport system substrate-binding protein